MHSMLYCAAPRRCLRVCALLLLALWGWQTAALAAPCPANAEVSDTTNGQINWSLNEPNCDGFGGGCNGRDPDTGPDGTVFSFRFKYTASVSDSIPSAAYLLIDTNGDTTYPCDPPADPGAIGVLGEPAPPVGPWALPLLGAMALGCIWLTVRRAHAWRLRLAGATGLALLVALGCGGGGGGGAAPEPLACAQQEAFILQLQTSTGNGAAGFDLERQIKLCGNARAIAFLFFVQNAGGQRVGGPAEGEWSMSTE